VEEYIPQEKTGKNETPSALSTIYHKNFNCNNDNGNNNNNNNNNNSNSNNNNNNDYINDQKRGPHPNRIPNNYTRTPSIYRTRFRRHLGWVFFIFSWVDCFRYLLLGCSVISVSFIICMLTLLLMPLAGLHFCVGLDFLILLVVIFLSKHHHHHQDGS
jgi:hypothetical protein